MKLKVAKSLRVKRQIILLWSYDSCYLREASIESDNRQVYLKDSQTA